MNFWLASHTQRWHTNPKFAHISDPISGHSGRISLLLLKIDPSISREALALAAVHDLGEAYCGDLAAPFKWKHPDVAAVFNDFETNAIGEMGFDVPVLEEREATIFRICDSLDAYLWASWNAPEYVANRNDWQVMISKVRQLALDVGVLDQVNTIIKEVHDGGF